MNLFDKKFKREIFKFQIKMNKFQAYNNNFINMEYTQASLKNKLNQSDSLRKI